MSQKAIGCTTIKLLQNIYTDFKGFYFYKRQYLSDSLMYDVRQNAWHRMAYKFLAHFALSTKNYSITVVNYFLGK